MFVLVTGGAGFIGSHSVEALLEIGARVRVLDDLSTGCRENLPEHHAALEFVHGDVRDGACVARCMQGITHVLHLAAQVSVPISIQQPVHSHSVNVAGYLNVLNTARLAGVQRVVHASSAAVYGVPVVLPLTEDSPVAPLSPYGLEKLVTDQYAHLFGELYGVSTLGLRYFNVYGPRQDPRSPYSGVISKFAALAIQDSSFTVFGDGLQNRDFIYVEDVARVNVAALQSTACGLINVATGHSVTLLEMAQMFAACVGHPIKVMHESVRAGDVPHSSTLPLRMRAELSAKETVALGDGLAQLILHLRAVP
ncbi:MAG: NAD-dependent epimerase/dehydratase family protein [Gallionella sp.]|nr:NAD-dependent epimerase/dehydratase family protein [Gallionella sp.]